MRRTALLLSPLLVACGDDTTEPWPTLGEDSGGSTVSSGWFDASWCDVDVPPTHAVHRLRQDPEGRLYVDDQGGTLTRYLRSGDEGECTLTLDTTWTPLVDVTDFSLDAEGRVYTLVFFAHLSRFEADGTVSATCDIGGAHGGSVTADGTRMYVGAIGEDFLRWVTFDDSGACAEAETLPLAHPVSTNFQALEGERLAVQAFDPGAVLPPAWILDTRDAGVLVDLGTGTDPYGHGEMVVATDFSAGTSGMWLADSIGRDLWQVDDRGAVVTRYLLDALLPVPDDPEPYLIIRSIDIRPAGVSYVSAGHVATNGIWDVVFPGAR